MTGSDVNRNSFSLPAGLAGPVALAIPGIVISFFGETGRELLRFDRAGIAAGDYWRFLTGHFAHLGIGHLVLNLAGLSALAWILSPTRPPLAWWLLTALSAIIAMDAGLVWLLPDLDWYVGLSGLLHGIWVAGAWRLIVHRERILGGLLAAAVGAKLLDEHFFGASATTTAISGGDVITAVHLFGATGGAAAAIGAALLAAVRLHRAKL